MNEIFISIFERLQSELNVSVFDHVPQDYDAYPFVKMETLEDGQNDTDTENGFNSTIQIHTWSEYRGSKEINLLQQDIYNALHQWQMPNTANYGISGGIRQTLKTSITNSDGIRRQGVQRFQLFYEPLPS